VLEVPLWAVRLVTAAVLIFGTTLGWWLRGRWQRRPKIIVLETTPDREPLH